MHFQEIQKKKLQTLDVQTSIRLPRELLKEAKLHALEHNTSLATVIVESLEYYLQDKE